MQWQNAEEQEVQDALTVAGTWNMRDQDQVCTSSTVAQEDADAEIEDAGETDCR